MKKILTHILRLSVTLSFSVGFYFVFSSFYLSVQLENTLYDNFLITKQRQPNPDIILITIDENSLKELGLWPWPRNYHAALIDKLTEAGAHAVILNILFSERSNADESLQKAILRNGKVILPIQPDNMTAKKTMHNDATSIFGSIAAKVGHAAILPDRDGVIRRISLFERINQYDYPSLSLATVFTTTPELQQYYLDLQKNHYFKQPILIPFSGAQNHFRQVSYTDVLAGRVPLNEFRDKVVFIGTNAPGLGDNYIPAIAGNYRLMSGTELQAQLYDALNQQMFINNISPLTTHLTNILLIFIVTLWVTYLSPLRGALVALIACTLIGFTGLLIFIYASLWIPLSSSLFLIAIFGIFHTAIATHLKIIEVNRLLEARVEERTYALLMSNQQLEQEIHERKIIALSLEDKEHQLRILLDNLHIGVLMVDKTGHIIAANQMIDALLGICPKAVIGQSISQYFSQSQQSNNNQIEINMILQSDQDNNYHTTSRYEVEAHHQNGKNFPVDITISHLKQSENDYYVCLIRDITEQRQAERITQEFIATVSHELRTPITSIRGSLALINSGATGELTPKSKNLLTIALRNSERLLMLVNDILDVQKIQLGSLDFNMRVINIVDVVQQSIEVNDSYAKNHQTSYVFKIPQPSYIPVLGDPDRLVQVMTNLLSNAAKFSLAGSVVDVSIETQNNQVKISVTDYGAGIPDNFKSKIFQKFAQADESKHRSKGTGLGLSITRALLEHMHGKIDFVSEVGKGSTFFFTLPIEHTKSPHG